MGKGECSVVDRTKKSGVHGAIQAAAKTRTSIGASAALKHTDRRMPRPLPCDRSPDAHAHASSTRLSESQDARAARPDEAHSERPVLRREDRRKDRHNGNDGDDVTDPSLELLVLGHGADPAITVGSSHLSSF